MSDQLINQDFNPTANPGSRTLLDYAQRLLGLTARNGVNQIRGNNGASSTGAGIPKQVTDLAAKVSNANTGSTSTVTVTFHRDPSDSAFAGVNVFVKGYQGNQTPTQVASGTDSPLQFILTNTGEAVSILVQAYGNSGNAPLSSSPTAGIKLPVSTSGGFGTQTVTSGSPVSGSAVAGQLAKFASPPTTVTGADLSQDVVTNASTVTTVEGIQTIPVTSLTPKDGDVLRYSISDGKYMRDIAWDFFLFATGSSTPLLCGIPFGLGTFASTSTGIATAPSSPSFLGIAGTQTNPAGTKVTCNAAAGIHSAGIQMAGSNTTLLGLYRRIRFRLQLNQTTATRIWIGLATVGKSEATYQSDTPNDNFIGFRYSTGASDTKYQCVTQTSNVASTKNAESTASHVDTNVHTFDITYDGTNITFYIDDVQVGKQSTNVPAASVGLMPAIYFDDVTTGASAWTIYYLKGTLALI